MPDYTSIEERENPPQTPPNKKLTARATTPQGEARGNSKHTLGLRPHGSGRANTPAGEAHQGVAGRKQHKHTATQLNTHPAITPRFNIQPTRKSTLTDMQYLHIGGPLNNQTLEAPGTLTYTPDGYPHIQDADKQYTLVIIGDEEIYAQATWCFRVAKAAWQRHRKEHPQ